jgi:hypothetical protein
MEKKGIERNDRILYSVQSKCVALLVIATATAAKAVTAAIGFNLCVFNLNDFHSRSRYYMIILSVAGR